MSFLSDLAKSSEPSVTRCESEMCSTSNGFFAPTLSSSVVGLKPSIIGMSRSASPVTSGSYHCCLSSSAKRGKAPAVTNADAPKPMNDLLFMFSILPFPSCFGFSFIS